MQIDPSVQFVALKKTATEITSSLTAQLTQNEVREALFFFFLAVAVSYIWFKEFGVLLFIGTFLILVTSIRIRNLKNKRI